MDHDTLASRIRCLVNHWNQQDPQLVTTIPTPDIYIYMSHGGNSTMIAASSVDTSMISASGSDLIAQHLHRSTMEAYCHLVLMAYMVVHLIDLMVM